MWIAEIMWSTLKKAQQLMPLIWLLIISVRIESLPLGWEMAVVGVLGQQKRVALLILELDGHLMTCQSTQHLSICFLIANQKATCRNSQQWDRNIDSSLDGWIYWAIWIICWSAWHIFRKRFGRVVIIPACLAAHELGWSWRRVTSLPLLANQL